MFDIILSININNESLYKFYLFYLYVLTNVETLYFSMERERKKKRGKNDILYAYCIQVN